MSLINTEFSLVQMPLRYHKVRLTLLDRCVFPLWAKISCPSKINLFLSRIMIAEGLLLGLSDLTLTAPSTAKKNKKKPHSTFPTACQLHTFDLWCKQHRHQHWNTHTLAHTWLIKTHTHLLELLRWIRLRGEGLLRTSAGIAERFFFSSPFSLVLVIMEPAWKCDPENKASSWGESHGNISPSIWTSLRSDATHSGHQGVDAVPPSPPRSARASQTPDASERRKQQWR